MSSAKKNKEKNKISDDQVINLLGNYVCQPHMRKSKYVVITNH